MYVTVGINLLKYTFICYFIDNVFDIAMGLFLNRATDKGQVDRH